MELVLKNQVWAREQWSDEFRRKDDPSARISITPVLHRAIWMAPKYEEF